MKDLKRKYYTSQRFQAVRNERASYFLRWHRAGAGAHGIRVFGIRRLAGVGSWVRCWLGRVWCRGRVGLSVVLVTAPLR